MGFLLDQDVYAVTARFLRDCGHDVVTASELGLSRAIDIGRHESADALPVGVLRGLNPALVGERRAEVHEPSAVPGAVSCASNVHR